MIDVFKKYALFISEGVLCFFLVIADVYAGNANISIESIDSESVTSQICINIGLQGHRGEIVDSNKFSLFVDGVRIENIKIEKDIDAIDDLMILMISVDSSKSVKKSFLKGIKKISSSIISSYGKTAQIAFYKFDNEMVLLRGFKAKDDEGIDSIANNGSRILLYDAIYNGIYKLSKSGDLNKSLIIFADGKDDGSSITLDDLLVYIAEQNIPVNFVTEKNNPKVNVLNRISRKTGGHVFYMSDDLVERNILQNLERSGVDKYKLTYKAENFWDRTHVLEVIYKSNDEYDRIISTQEYPGYWKKYLSLPFMSAILIIFLILAFLAGMIFIAKKKMNKDNVVENINDSKTQESLFPGKDSISSFPIENNEQNAHFLRGWLIHKEGGDSGKKIPLYWKELDIGCNPKNGLVVNAPEISSNHARIKFARESFYLLDLASENGTYLNGKKVLRPKRLNDWDEIKIGRITFIFRGIHNRV